MKKFLALLTLSFIYSCIPLEDIESPLVIPNIDDFPIREIYYYSDTMFIKAIYTDNSTLDTIGFQISKKEILPNETPWNALFRLNVRGRRFDTLYKVVVPNYKTQGDYHLSLFARDAEGNFASVTKEFKLGGDITPPTLSSLTLGLPMLNNRFFACRNTPIPITSGVASDNIEIRRIGIAINGQEFFTQLSTRSVDIRQVLNQFADRLRIPATATDGSIVSFAVIVEDGAGNRTVQSFEIFIDCDDEAPVLELIASQPSVNSSREVNVIQGTTFRITEMTAQDNRFLDSAFVYFNPTATSAVLVERKPLKTSAKVNLAEILNLTFAIPAEEPVGKKYDIRIVASDSSNRTAEYKIQLTVLEDKPPVLFVGPTYVNGLSVVFSEDRNRPLAVRVGNIITFDGRVEEDNVLEYFAMTWNDKIVVELRNITKLPINLADYQDLTSFAIPRDVAPGTVFVLTITAIDKKRQKVEKQFFFVVS